MDSSNNQNKQGGEKEFSIQPIKDKCDSSNTSSTAGILKAQPGPAIPKEMPEKEGTKQDREAKMESLNR
ncbi:hypothetical protein G6O67_008359 [Ophiocordyceps sinensis]|uniref:Uncharacterized protein n=2 Tax=Ophiocordyceps sinensis TaxID=72228 RepID=A0A8H4PFS2_9HYPO|nr:hypothetical protein OCS_04009 [Ophiocordyceps sinensis CO18]KAF4504172.1 hypothetical protein G6O67_008359 [Ophiocordyceps sinensis]